MKFQHNDNRLFSNSIQTQTTQRLRFDEAQTNDSFDEDDNEIGLWVRQQLQLDSDIVLFLYINLDSWNSMWTIHLFEHTTEQSTQHRRTSSEYENDEKQAVLHISDEKSEISQLKTLHNEKHEFQISSINWNQNIDSKQKHTFKCAFFLWNESDFLQVCLNFCLCSCFVFCNSFINISIDCVCIVRVISSKDNESSNWSSSTSTSTDILWNSLNSINISLHCCSIKCQNIVMSCVQDISRTWCCVQICSWNILFQKIELNLWICLCESDSSCILCCCIRNWYSYRVVAVIVISSRLHKSHNCELTWKRFSTIEWSQNSFLVLIIISTSFDDSIFTVLNSIIHDWMILSRWINKWSVALIHIDIEKRVHGWTSSKFSRDWISLHNNYCWTSGPFVNVQLHAFV